VREQQRPDDAIEAEEQAQKKATAALQAPRSSGPNQVTQQAAEIEGTCVNQKALEDVRPTSRVCSPHPACFVEVCERALDSFAAHPL
jgi:hypothetical protein